MNCNKVTFNGTLCDLLDGHVGDCLSEITARKIHEGHQYEMTYDFGECPRIVCTSWRLRSIYSAVSQ